MRFVLAIDPGDKHVGMASWATSSEAKAWEVDASLALWTVDELLHQMEDRVALTLVIEKFQLYPNKAPEQSGSEMLTAQMIGALKWIAHLHSAEVVEQGASIKKPTVKQLAARGIKRVGVGTGSGSHASDAELHLYYYLIRSKLWSARPS